MDGKPRHTPLTRWNPTIKGLIANPLQVSIGFTTVTALSPRKP